MPVTVFLLVFTSQKINTKRSPNAAKLFEDFFGPEDIQWAKEVPEGSSEESTTHKGALGGPGAQVCCAHLGGLLHRLFAL